MPIPIPPKTFYSPSTFLPPLLNTRHGRSAALSASRNDPSKSFRAFALQQGAFDFCDANPLRQLRVWSFEKDGQGRRRYVAASYDSFWHAYARWIRRGREMHFYEVIRERYACKVYFDLEFEWKWNQGRDVEGMVESLMWGCEAVLGRRVGKRGVQGWGVVELDSTSERKFSRHLVLERVAFNDNVQVGEFVRRVVERVVERDERMMMVDKEGDKVPFVDMGVYTKNRCFRLVGSSKFGKQERLKVLGQQAGKPVDRVCVSRDTFMRSLVCHVGADVEVMGVGSATEMNLLAPRARKPYANPPTQNTDLAYKREQKSDFPRLDAYVHALIRPYNGGISGVTMLGGACTVMYAIKGGYKYCGNIGRHHKSNNVILVADLSRAEMHQRCFDPDCRGYRSEPWRIAVGVLGTEEDHVFIDESVSDDCLREMMERMDRGGWEALSMAGGQGGAMDGGVGDEELNLLMDCMEGAAAGRAPIH